jgi:Uma2 family endonuclease
MVTSVTTAPIKSGSATDVAAPIRYVTSTTGGAVPLRRFTVAEYQRMIDEGYFSHDEAYELLDGLIIHKLARDPLHDASLAHARRILSGRLPPTGFHVRVQSAVLATDSQPEPDLAVVRGSEFDYIARHPSKDDLSLVVEVANSSLADDRAWKGAIYALAGFPVYLIVNLIDSRIEVYSDPSGVDPAPAYRRREDFHSGDVIGLNLGGSPIDSIPVIDLLPPVLPRS